MTTLDDIQLRLVSTQNEVKELKTLLAEEKAQLTLLQSSVLELKESLVELQTVISDLRKVSDIIKLKTDKLPKGFVRAGATYRIR